MMSARKAITPERMPLYPTEARIVTELYGSDAPIEMLKAWDAVAFVLERDGLPKRDPLFGNRRYWPAVAAFLHRRNGLTGLLIGSVPDGEEDWA